jgi:hypothetical protein
MRIISAVKEVEFVTDRMSYIILRGHWFHIILNVHSPTEDKIGDEKDSIYEDWECIAINSLNTNENLVRRLQISPDD